VLLKCSYAVICFVIAVINLLEVLFINLFRLLSYIYCVMFTVYII